MNGPKTNVCDGPLYLDPQTLIEAIGTSRAEGGHNLT
jgi:hypothetical protein